MTTKFRQGSVQIGGLGLNRREIAAFNKYRLLDTHGIDYFSRDDEIHFDCPFCDDDRKRFYLNSVTGFGHCHNCKWSSKNIVRFVSEFTGLGMDRAEDYVRQSVGKWHYQAEAERHAEKADIDLPVGYHPLRWPIHGKQERFWKYLREVRSNPVKIDSVLDYELGYTVLGQYRDRVVIPVYWDDELVSFVARAISKTQEPKVLTPRGNKESEYLFNLDRLWGAKELVLCEGPFDVLRIPDLAVCSFGTHLSASQISLLKESGCRRVIIAWDDDTWQVKRELGKLARQAPIIQLWHKLESWFDVWAIDLPAGEDPDSMDEARLRYLIGNPERVRDIERRRRW